MELIRSGTTFSMYVLIWRQFYRSLPVRCFLAPKIPASVSTARYIDNYNGYISHYPLYHSISLDTRIYILSYSFYYGLILACHIDLNSTTIV